jgi:pyrrolidone-carboxylate peptidase
MKKILITGFTPFGQYMTNVSEIIAKSLDGKKFNIGGEEVCIKAIILPINFELFRNKLEEAVNETKPIVAIGLGMDFKDLNNLSLETLANKKPNYNILKDSVGKIAPNKNLDNLSDELELPNKDELIKISDSIEGIEQSNNAGRWMCETVFRDLIRLSQNGKKFQPCFIHVPHTKNLLEISKSLDEHKNWMDLERQKKILLEIIMKITKFYLNDC